MTKTTTQPLTEPPAEHSDTARKPRPGRPCLGSKPMNEFVRFRADPELSEFCSKLGSQGMRRILQACADKSAGRPEHALRGEVLASLLREFDPRTVSEAGESIDRWEALASCGFPSPALDYAHESLNLNDFFLHRPVATIAVTARGDSMIDAGIFDGDVLFVDRSIEAHSGDIVLAFVDGSFTVKELRLTAPDGLPELHPHNSSGEYPVIRPAPDEDFWVEGVVVSIGRRLRAFRR